MMANYELKGWIAPNGEIVRDTDIIMGGTYKAVIGKKDATWGLNLGAFHADGEIGFDGRGIANITGSVAGNVLNNYFKKVKIRRNESLTNGHYTLDEAALQEYTNGNTQTSLKHRSPYLRAGDADRFAGVMLGLPGVEEVAYLPFLHGNGIMQ